MALVTTTILAIAAVALAAAGTGMAVKQSMDSADAASDAAKEQNEYALAEGERQQKEIYEVTREQKSDVIRKADAQIGTLRTITGGTAGDFSRMVAGISGSEGRDLARIESNKRGQIAAVEAAKKASQVATLGNLRQITNQKKSAITKSAFNFAGSALQIGGGAYRAPDGNLSGGSGSNYSGGGSAGDDFS